MKLKAIIVVFVMLSFTIFAFAPKADNYNVDIANSMITWEGKKLTGSHNGTLMLNDGTLLFNGKKLVGGTFTADMSSIKDVDNNTRLMNHLKSDDFFGVEKFPTAKFVITKVTGAGNNYQVTGNFNIKGKTNPISFPVQLTWNNDKTVSAIADKIIIDRTKFGIEYKSKSIFSTLGNNFINDEFVIGVKLVTKK